MSCFSLEILPHACGPWKFGLLEVSLSKQIGWSRGFFGSSFNTAGIKSKSLVLHWLERKGCRRVKNKPDPTTKQPSHYKALQKQRNSGMRPALGAGELHSQPSPPAISEITGNGARREIPWSVPPPQDHVSLHPYKHIYHAVLKPSGARNARGNPVLGDS